MTDETGTAATAVETPPATRGLPDWAVWTAYPLAIVAMLGLLSLVLFEAFSRQIPWWGKLLVVGFSVIAVSVWMFEKRDVLTARRSLVERLHDGSTLQAAFALILMISGVLPNVLGLIRPAAAVEDRPGLIQSGVADANAKLEQTNAALNEIARDLAPVAAARAPIRDELPGLWGEAGGCEVVWQIGLEGDALTAEVVRKPDGLPDYKLTASVISAEGMILHAFGESPAEEKSPANARGVGATFSVDRSGAIPRLTWFDRSRTAPLVLEPCS